jgi:predicted flap endonuclease-1-like 5' DNA nuclease
MIYLIGQLSVWLLLTAAFAALAGWAFAAERAAPAERALRRDRDNLLRDIIRLASGEAESSAAPLEEERGADAMRRMAEIKEGRIAELERVTEAARGRADEAAGEIAELERRLERAAAEAAELRRALAQEAGRPNAVDAIVEDAPSEQDAALQGWRLRYFEQRVRYLEGQARAAAAPAAPALDTQDLEWRAREAEARAAHLESELRAAAAARDDQAEATESPFAASPEIDALLRWRMLYLERRVAHLQRSTRPVAPAPRAAVSEAAPDPDRWKWRARYLEARVRHLEQRTAPAALTPARGDVEPAAPAPLVPLGSEEKPPVLAAARNGAPDDLTLIDGVSLLQQSTLNALGVFHFDQIAAWSAANIAWVDQYLRLRGRIVDEEWVDQARELARHGPAARRQNGEGAY